jgi:hypothetical protein
VFPLFLMLWFFFLMMDKVSSINMCLFMSIIFNNSSCLTIIMMMNYKCKATQSPSNWIFNSKSCIWQNTLNILASVSYFVALLLRVLILLITPNFWAKVLKKNYSSNWNNDWNKCVHENARKLPNGVH